MGDGERHAVGGRTQIRVGPAKRRHHHLLDQASRSAQGIEVSPCNLLALAELGEGRCNRREFETGRLNSRAIIDRCGEAHLLTARHEGLPQGDIRMQVAERAEGCEEDARHESRLPAASARDQRFTSPEIAADCEAAIMEPWLLVR